MTATSTTSPLPMGGDMVAAVVVRESPQEGMTMSDKRYNGWTNYETWNVALWLDNDQGSYNHWREKAQDAYDGAESSHRTREEEAAYTLAASLRADMEEAAPDLGASCWSDLLTAALSEVNWDEIAAHYIDEVDKDAEIDASDPSEEEQEAAGE